MQVKIEEETNHLKGERESMFLQVHFGFVDGWTCWQKTLRKYPPFSFNWKKKTNKFAQKGPLISALFVRWTTFPL